MNGRLVRVLAALMFLAGLSIFMPQEGAAASYINSDTLHNLTFSNLTAMQQSSNSVENLNYLININNTGNATYEEYNLTVVNCSNLNQAGVGVLSSYFLNLSQNQSGNVSLYVSNDTAGLYSSCIMAGHWNGSETETSWNLTSSADGVIMNSSFYPDLSASAIHWASSGGNITVHNATIANSGSFNFSGNISVSLFWDGAYRQNITVESANLANGTFYNISFNNITSAANGVHNLTVWVDALNNVTESNETNNNYTASVPVLGFNVTVLSVTCHNGTDTAPNKNVTINVSVKYENGSSVTNLTKENFTVYDIYSGSVIDTWDSGDAILNSSFVSTMNSSGIYWFNITSHNGGNLTNIYPGQHNLTVYVSNNESGNNYSGSNTGANYYYLIVPKLVVTLTAPSGTTSVSEGNTKAITVNISNTGTDTINNVYVTATDDSEFLSVPSNPSCTAASLSNGSYLLCTSLFSATTTAVSSTEYPTITVTAYGTHNYSGSPLLVYYKEGTIQLTIINVDDSGDDDAGGGGGGGGGTSCTSDASCTANQSCVSRVCTAISCANGEILDHVCIPSTTTYKINITDYSPAITALSEGNASAKVTVKNTGTKTFTAKLEVTISGITATVTPASYSLGGGESYQFTVGFSVPNSTRIGNFSGSYKAYVSTSTSTYDSKSFTFSVLPLEETKSQINLSYQEMALMLANLSSQLNRLKALGYNQSVLSPIENLMNSANSTLSLIKSSIDSNDYITAQSLVTELNASIGNIESEIVTAESQKSGSGVEQLGMWFWAAVIVIILFVAGFFVYMFYPSSSHKGYHPERGFVHPDAKKEGIGDKIKRIFKRKKKEAPSESITSISSFAKTMAEERDEEHYDTFHYSEGYKKERSYDYGYGKGARGLFQKLRRKKDKKGPQMHLDQFSQQTETEQAEQSEQK